MERRRGDVFYEKKNRAFFLYVINWNNGMWDDASDC